MAWNTTLVQRLRYYIGDTSNTPTYIDSVLSQFIALAAISVVSEIETNITWTIDTDTPSISPDPVTDSSVPAGISNLFVAKAACIIARSEVRSNLSRFGIKFKDDLTSYDGTSAIKGGQDNMKNFCDSYLMVKEDWEIGNISTTGRAIVGPFSPADSSFCTESFLLGE